MKPYWSGEQVTLYLGDCREVTEWLSADVLVTDPPYGIKWKSAQQQHYSTRNPRVRVVQGDESTQARDEALALWGRKPAVVFGTWRRPRPPKITHRLIWHKRRAGPALTTSAFYAAEEEIYLIGSGWQGKPRQNVIATDEWRSGQGPTRQTDHPTFKPLSLMEILIAACPPGTIADPFCGSGSTLVAARNLGRRAVGVEIEERYAEMTARRLDQGVLLPGAV